MCGRTPVLNQVVLLDGAPYDPTRPLPATTLLPARLLAVATQAQRLPVADIVARSSISQWHDVIGVSLSALTAQPAACDTLPVVACQHSLTPRPVCHAAVATLCCVGPILAA